MQNKRTLDLANNARVANKEAMQLWVLELILNGKTVKEIEMMTNYSKSRIYDAIKIFDNEFVSNAYTNHFRVENKVTFQQYQTFIELNCNYKQYQKQYVENEVVSVELKELHNENNDNKIELEKLCEDYENLKVEYDKAVKIIENYRILVNAIGLKGIVED